ncbi:MAG: hypothetical protein HOE92_06675 [Euryarchaeota archaeon]|nr:hypothetical protein [Euryarchaeota archaeon]MBT6644618.1 hypothetical protein [Euryarchaeota archaeon]
MPVLHLAEDKTRPTDQHFDEFAARGALILLTLVITSAFWWLKADELLDTYLSIIVPCNYQECMVVFDPSAWISTRWMLIFMLSVFTSMPVIMWQFNRFATPGLLPRERLWLRKFIIFTSISGVLLVYFTMFFALPKIFAFGHQQNLTSGLVARYDAAELLRISLTIAWVELLILLAIIAVAVAGVTGLLTSHTASWWRLRVHGFLLGLLWLIIPETLSGVRLITIALAALFVEMTLRPFANSEGPNSGLESGRGILDAEGALRRIGLIDCSCSGVCPQMPLSVIPSGTTGHRAFSLCTSPVERDLLLERVRDERWTDVNIVGCDGTPLPFNLKDSFAILAINLSGLNALKSITARAMPAANPAIEYKLALDAQVDPWTTHGVRQRQLSTLQALSASNEQGLTHLYYSTKGLGIPWGLVLSPNHYFMPGSSKVNEKIKILATENGWTLIDVDKMST